MILDLRFLTGVAVGGVLALVVAPQVGRLGIDVPMLKDAIKGKPFHAQATTNESSWPSDETAKRELFKLSKWDFADFGPKSEVEITRCINLDAISMACEMATNLSWIKEETVIEAVFKRDAENWHMLAAKTM